MGFPPISGSFGVGTGGTAAETNAARGVWLWRPSGFDHSPPVIVPTIDGAEGSNGWFVSDLSVSWEVRDDESVVSERVGCDPATVTSDTSGANFSCRATSEGGTSTGSAVVRRDTIAPTLTCATPEPVIEIYQVGARVRASVADATSGPAAASAFGFANTGRAGSFTTTVTGTDRAGNTGKATCPYRVIVPTCHGLTATRVGTALNDAITGTAGRDVIVALGGADAVDGAGGADVICGGDGPDTIHGAAGNDWIDGGASSDDIYGGAGDDNLDGGLHLDSLRGENGRDTCTSGEIRMSSCEIVR
jgi:Ca2+-binding RTX toxin-like protein